MGKGFSEERTNSGSYITGQIIKSQLSIFQKWDEI